MTRASGEVRVLVVGAETGQRRLLEQVVGAMPGAAIVATAANFRIALAKMRGTEADLTILDLDGDADDPGGAMEALRAAHPGIAFVLTGNATAATSHGVAEALRKGALDFVATPPGGGDEEGGIRDLQRRLGPLLGLCSNRRHSQGGSGPPSDPRPNTAAAATPAPRAPGGLLPRVQVVVVAVSTGGPDALGQVVPRLPGNLGVPVLVVQHMPAGLEGSFARTLSSRGELPVRVAEAGAELLPGVVYLAPGNRHMLVHRGRDAAGLPVRRIELSEAPPENSVRPSADALFRSVAAAYDGTVLAVIMTGMGADGLAGVRALKNGHCYCVTQSAETCAVYGMPRSVDEAGLADESVALDRLVDRIAAVVAGRG